MKRVDSMIADLKKQQKSDELAEIERKRRESEEKERLEIEAKKEAERQREMLVVLDFNSILIIVRKN